MRTSTAHVWEVAGGVVALVKFDAGSPVSAAICSSSAEGTATGVARHPAGSANVPTGGFANERVWVCTTTRGAVLGAVSSAFMVKPYFGSSQTLTFPCAPMSAAKTLAETPLTVSVPEGVAFESSSAFIATDAANGSPQSPLYLP